MPKLSDENKILRRLYCIIEQMEQWWWSRARIGNHRWWRWICGFPNSVGPTFCWVLGFGPFIKKALHGGHPWWSLRQEISDSATACNTVVSLSLSLRFRLGVWINFYSKPENVPSGLWKEHAIHLAQRKLFGFELLAWREQFIFVAVRPLLLSQSRVTCSSSSWW